MKSEKAFLIDLTECVGCGACYSACKEANNLPETSDDPLKDTLSDKTFTVIEQRGDYYVRNMCKHCLEPTCVSVCPVGAFTKTEFGAVLYDESKCLGCRYCMQACPFQIPRYEWGSLNPRVQKCIMCYNRLKEGKIPACAEACPTSATTFGDRKEIIALAKQKLIENPDKYHNYIYGLNEVGGTSVLYLSAVPFEVLGFNMNLVQTALPNFTHDALSKIPTLVSVGGVLLTGFYWLTNRKNEVLRKEYLEKKEKFNREEFKK